ncbi:hypothetical protein DYB25_006712 [Aphanomyces astaci]|uniref:Prolyl 4-hydroxylase alpha subunit domain-containing protein n=3 Tax=Aphanomyces astaci TaxID=112090 RepID=A0A397BJK6_APHAT|nr:hypothetical protein DYB25_006712 [Aphanomyces astaci]
MDIYAEPSLKKVKPEPTAVLHPGLLNQSTETRRSIRDQCLSNAPFPHYQIPVLCTPEHMRKVHVECVEELQSTFKETDLFKLYQTIDLGNLQLSNPLAKKLPALLQLRNALVDCAANVYMAGCHLLPHDDVIGTRCISYVIYLSDPDDEWTAADGGALELYPSESPGVPALVPTAFALPTYNSLALFPVAPGISFHSVQDQAPVGVEEATATQLTAIEASQRPFEPVEVESEDQLTEAELVALTPFINAIYLTKDTLEQIQDAFQGTGSIQLQSFLTAQWASAIDTATRAADSADQLGHGKVPAYTAGYSTDDSNHWTPQGPLFLQRYLRYTGAAPAASEVLKLQSSLTDAKDVNTTKAGATPPTPSSPGRLLAHVQTALVQSPAFVKWLSLATGVSPTGSRSEVRRLRPGLDYTLAHQATTSSPPIILDAVLCFCDDVSQEGDDEAPWSASGFECYMRAVADGVGDVAAAAFNGEDSTDEDDDAAPVQIGAQNNTLSLVVRDTSTMKFVKFVSCRERGSRWDVNVEYTLPNP